MSSRAKKLATKPKADRTNKKADVVAMMKSAEGARLSEIMAATEWQAHTVRGFVERAASFHGYPSLIPEQFCVTLTSMSGPDNREN
jgi:Protein of unknown function (DUF3489)